MALRTSPRTMLGRVSYLNFLAGLLAAVGTGYLSALSSSSGQDKSALLPILTTAALWILASAVLAMIAQQYSSSITEIEGQGISSLSESEQFELTTLLLSQRATRRLWLWLILGLLLVCALVGSGIVYMWSEVFAAHFQVVEPVK